MILTFYSYKGGVGRSMALANVAHLLYLRGLKVVMVDWDLEAPGLENFFYTSAAELDRVRSHLGVIDLLTAYKRQFPYLTASGFRELAPLESFLCDVTPEAEYATDMPPASARGRLRLLTAGWRSGDRFAEYAETVQEFDWGEFYARFRGQEYFEWLRNQLNESGEVVLVDSRTGVSEMSGVCTRQLADIVVAACAPNSQNLHGTLDMVKSFQNSSVETARGRALEVVVLPARVDDADSKGYDAFRSQFESLAENLTPAVFREWKRTLWSLLIPYKAQYAYRESLVTGIAAANKEIEEAYKMLAAHLALFSAEGSPLLLACERELRVLATLAGKELNLGASAWQTAEAAFARLSPEDAEAARPVLLRLVNLSVSSPDLDSRRRAALDEFHGADAASLLERLAAMGVISKVHQDSKTDAFEFAHDAQVKGWPRLRQWIASQRAFLIWRQDLAGQARKWQESGRDSSLLLRGAQIDDANQRASEYPDEINAFERAFLEGSRTSGEEEKRLALERQNAERAAREELEKAILRRRRKARIGVAVSVGFAFAVILAAVLIIGWTRSDAHQANLAFTEGVNLKASSEDSKLAWRTALLVSGHIPEAIANLRKIPAGPERAGALAAAATVLLKAGRDKDAQHMAEEALDLPNADVIAANYANSQAQVMAVLYAGGLSVPQEKWKSLQEVIAALENPLDKVAALRPLLRVPIADLHRQYLNAVDDLHDQVLQAQLYTALATAVGNSDPEMARNFAKLAENLAERTGRVRLQVEAIIASASAQPSPELKAAELKRALSYTDKLEGMERIREIAAVATAAQTVAPETASIARERVRALASETKTPEDRIDAIIVAVKLSANAGEFEPASELAGRLADAADRAQLFAQIAETAFAAHHDDARILAVRALNEYDSIPTGGQTLSHSLPLAMIPILYPDALARATTKKLNSTESWLALAKGANSKEDSLAKESRETALKLAMAISEKDESRPLALAAVAKSLTEADELRRARLLAQELPPDERLQVLAAILFAVKHS